MKLKNKIIPIVSTLATASVIVPLTVSMTSCSPWIRMYDVKDGPFQPDIFQLDSGELDQFGATAAYVDECKANPRTFIQDIMYGQSTFVHAMLNEYFTERETEFQINKFEIGVSKPSFGTAVTWGLGEEDWTYPTVSFEQHLNLEIEFLHDVEDEPGVTQRQILSVDVDASYKDVIFYTVCDLTSAAGSWKIGMFDDSTWYDAESFDDALLPYIFNTQPWSVGVNVDVHQTQIIHDDWTETTNVIESSWNKNETLTDAVALQEFRNLWWINPSTSFRNIADLMFAAASRCVIFNYSSYYLKQISPSFDVRQQKPLEVGGGSWQENQVRYIDGLIVNNVIGDVVFNDISLYDPEDPDSKGNISFVQNPITVKEGEDPMVIKTVVGEEVGGQVQEIHIFPPSPQAPNMVHIAIPCVIEGAPHFYEDVGPYYTFNTGSKALYFSVTAQGRPTKALTCYLSYNSLLVDTSYSL